MRGVEQTAILVTALVLLLVPATAQSFDNSGEGTWKEYMSFPIITTPTEYAQYKIVVNGTNWELYNVTGSLETSGKNDYFWSFVNSSGADIRAFNQTGQQLYFWVEYFNATEQKAVIWVNLTAGSSELNIAYGNPSALPSAYNNISMIYEIYDEFEGSAGSPPDPAKWDYGKTNYGIIELDGNGHLKMYSTKTGGAGSFASSWIIWKLKKVTDVFAETHIIEPSGGWEWDTQDAFIVRFNGVWDDTYYPDTGYLGQGRCSETWTNNFGYVYMGEYNSGELWRDDYQPNVDVNEYWMRFYVRGTTLRLYISTDGVNYQLVLENTTIYNLPSGYFAFRHRGMGDRADNSLIDYIKALKSADPADFGTPSVKRFEKKFGTKTVYVNVTYLDTNTTERYNPAAYYKLEDKPQINISSMLSVSGVNATYGANISIELIDFVTLDRVVYNGTDVTANLTYQGTITNATTGYDYNVYNFTTYEDGILEIYGHVGNKAHETTYKLDGETVDIFNVTVVVGEALEIALPHRGNVTLASIVRTNVTTVLINTKDVGVGAKTLSITISDPENFTVGYVYRTVNVDWGKVNFSVTDLQNETFSATYGFFNKNLSILSTDPSKLYAGDIEIDVYFHEVKLKSLEIHLNHTNNGLTLNVSVNATQFKDYRDVTRIVASPKYFEVVNLSTKYPFSVMKLVNVSGAVVIDFVSNAPTSVKVEGATSYSYEKAVLKITASSNVTVTDLYKLSAQLKDRLGNPVNFYVSINGSRVDASNGVVSKLLKPSWYKVEVPITVSGFELWKFNDSSNIALVEISTSDKTLPTAEYRVPSKIESKEVRLQRLSFPFLSSKPAQEETPIVRLEGTLRDFYNAPVANKTVKIEIVSPNFTRIYTLTTDESGNFKVDVDMARGVEYKVTYKFAGDDVYVGTSTTKTFTVEQLLPAPPEEIENILILIGIVIGLVAVVAGGIYLARKTKAKTLARMENEFKFFKRIK